MTKLIVAFRYFANVPKCGKQEDQLRRFFCIFYDNWYIRLIFPHYVKRLFEGKPCTTIWHTCASTKSCQNESRKRNTDISVSLYFSFHVFLLCFSMGSFFPRVFVYFSPCLVCCNFRFAPPSPLSDRNLTSGLRSAGVTLTFRHRASCILGQAFHYSPENALYIFNQQMYIII